MRRTANDETQAWARVCLWLSSAGRCNPSVLTESGLGEGNNYTVTREDYDLIYWIDGERCSLRAAMENAIAWCKRELASIETKLPEKS